ncbi:MAG: nuclease-related domain-containing protein [Nitriliruptoraceae bacterium]
MASDQVRVHHDRRMPPSRANLDHIAVARSGVVTIDAQRYAGRQSTRGTQPGSSAMDRGR